MFYRNLRSVMITLNVGGRTINVPLISHTSDGFKYLKDNGFDSYVYAYVPVHVEYGKNHEILFELDGFLVPDKYIREFVENH